MEKNNQALKYNKITYEMRAKLIEMVCSESIPCIQAGKRLGISPSTAKMIVKKFRENGRIFEKKAERIKRQHLEEFRALSEQQTNSQSPVPEAPMPFYFYIPFPIVDGPISECFSFTGGI